MSGIENDPFFEFRQRLKDILPKAVVLPEYRHPQEASTLNTAIIKDNFAPFTPTLPRDAYLGALIAQQSYNKPEDRAQSLDIHYKYISNLSNDRICVYVHQFLTGIAYIGVRGTRVSDLEDIRADARIVMGNEYEDPLVKTTNQQVRNILNTLQTTYDIGQDTTTLVGHSLGGLLICYAGFQTQCKIDCFNIGIAPTQSGGVVFNNQNITSYVMETDPIAASSGFVIKDTVVLRPKPMPNNPLQAHSLAFLINRTKPEFPIRK